MRPYLSIITLGVRDLNRAKQFYGQGLGWPIQLSYIVRSQERVDAVLAEAERAGGTIARPAQRAAWGGYFGYFADRDGYLWKVAAGAGEQPYAAE